VLHLYFTLSLFAGVTSFGAATHYGASNMAARPATTFSINNLRSLPIERAADGAVAAATDCCCRSLIRKGAAVQSISVD
jgi:hypothetical protein